MLKGVLISRYSRSSREAAYKDCRQLIGHNLEDLKRRLSQRGVGIPPNMAKDFATVLTWANEMRYEPGDEAGEHAQHFLKSAKRLLVWAERTGSW